MLENCGLLNVNSEWKLPLNGNCGLLKCRHLRSWYQQYQLEGEGPSLDLPTNQQSSTIMMPPVQRKIELIGTSVDVDDGQQPKPLTDPPSVPVPHPCNECQPMSSRLAGLIREANLSASCAFVAEGQLQPRFTRMVTHLRSLAWQIATYIKGAELLQYRKTILYLYQLITITMGQAVSAVSTMHARIAAACASQPDPLPVVGCAVCEDLCSRVCGILVYNVQSDIEELKRSISAAVHEICHTLDSCFFDLSTIHSIKDGALTDAQAISATVAELQVEIKALRQRFANPPTYVAPIATELSP